MNAQVTKEQIAAAQEMVRRKRARDSLENFREYMADTSEDFARPPARHHKVMMAALERFERGEIQRLLILAPPGSAKSTYCSVQFALWHLSRIPSQNILCASNTTDRATYFNRRRRNVCLTPEWRILSGTKLDENFQGAEQFATEKGGECKAVGVTSTVTGYRSYLNILDDPISGFEEAQSATQLEKVWQWFLSDFRTRLVPNGKELIVSTRWAKRDVAGRILELVKNVHEDWTVIRLPMLCDSADDPLGRAIGDPLWPEWFGDRVIVENKRDPLRWSAMYQQVPLDESGAWIGAENIQYEDAAPANLKYIIAVDLALTLGKGDYTAIVVAGLDWQRKLHIVHVERDRTEPDKTAERIYSLVDQYSPIEVLIDDDNASKMFRTLLIEKARTKGKTFPLSPLPIRGRDKETRASAIRGHFSMRSVFVVRNQWWNADLHRELLEFPSGDHDDQIDALSLIGRRLSILSGPDAPPRVRSIDSMDRSPVLVRMNPDGSFQLNTTLDEMWADRDQTQRQRERL